MTDPQIVKPTRFERAAPTRRRRLLAPSPAKLAIAAVFIVLTLITWFMFSARAVRFTVTPPEASMTLDGILPTYLVGGRYLMQPGNYILQASAPGHYDLTAKVVVGSDTEQDFEFSLERLPGTLIVTTAPDPGAQVLLDQELAGETPLTIESVAAGVHDVVISHPRYLPYQTEIQIEGMERTQTLAATLEPAWADISVSSMPVGAQVLLDGAEMGETPLTFEALRGTREVRLRKPGYKVWQTQITVVAQVDQDLSTVALTRSDGKLQVRSTPPGANLTIAGDYYGQTPLSVAIPPGRDYELALTLAGHEPERRSITIAPEEDQSLNITLRPMIGTVVVASNPAGAELFVDGKRVGVTGKTLELPARRHSIRLELAGHVTHEAEVLPQPGLAQHLNVLLQTEEEARDASIPQQIVTVTGERLQLIIPGELKMGAPRREPGRRSNEVEKDVLLTRPYYLAIHETTNAAYKQFAPAHDSGMLGRALLSDDDRPVVNVAWDQAVQYCNWLSDQEDLPRAYESKGDGWQLVQPVNTGYRLPTEAEWAWAARYATGEQSPRFPWGAAMPPAVASGNFADEAAANMVPYHIKGYSDSFRGTAPPGTFAANALGIHDLAGNVSEWVSDRYAFDPSREQLVDPTGPESGNFYVIRGSNYTHGRFGELRWTYRDYGADPLPSVGIRLARYLE